MIGSDVIRKADRLKPNLVRYYELLDAINDDEIARKIATENAINVLPKNVRNRLKSSMIL